MYAIFDTNIFVGAGFNPGSASAALIEAARKGELTLVWDAATRDETRRVLTKIPRLSWEAVADIFVPESAWTGDIDLNAVSFVEDPGDRKFAALSLVTGAMLVSSDSDLLDHRNRLLTMPPVEFLKLLYPKCVGATELDHVLVDPKHDIQSEYGESGSRVLRPFDCSVRLLQHCVRRKFD